MNDPPLAHSLDCRLLDAFSTGLLKFEPPITSSMGGVWPRGPWVMNPKICCDEDDGSTFVLYDDLSLTWMRGCGKRLELLSAG